VGGTNGLSGTNGTSGAGGTSGVTTSNINGTSGISIVFNGNSGYIPKYTNSSLNLGNSLIQDNGSNITVTNDAYINTDVRIGKGNSSVSTNIVLGNGLPSATGSSYHNIIIGKNAGQGISSSGSNIVIGSEALRYNINGSSNVAIGYAAHFLGEGTNNVAVGTSALGNTVGSVGITAVGYNAAPNISTGTYNTLIGYSVGGGITTGSYNTIIGAQVSGLSSSLSNRIIIADGQGNIRIYSDNSGNVGIGTGVTTLSYKLSVEGDTYSSLGFYVRDSANTFIGSSNSMSGIIVNGTSYDTNIVSGGNSVIYLKSAGNVGIGATPSYKLDVSGDIRSTAVVRDQHGDIRTLPANSKTAAYTLAATDTGRYISITTGGVTVPSATFSAGQVVTIYNDSASNQTITQGASVTMYLAGSATNGNRTLAQRGLCTILCVGTNTFVISGSGLT
jgi:hypothetical protein